MTDRYAELDAALERVLASARAHLAAVKAADGVPDDDAVWGAYVALNNASHEYDEQLSDAFGEVTPWDLEAITGDEDDSGAPGTLISDEVGGGGGDDPYPHVISVRQRRDYRVPSVAALLRLAAEGRPLLGDDEFEPIETVGDAILELLQSGDGSLGMLDIPELDPLDGVVLVAEVEAPLDTSSLEGGAFQGELAADGDGPFRLGAGDLPVGRLNEQALADLDD